MTEWGVVVVIIALVGLIMSICGPVVKNTKAMTELTITMKILSEKLDTFESKNARGHEKIWEHEKEQDSLINDHEIRISKLEDTEK